MSSWCQDFASKDSRRFRMQQNHEEFIGLKVITGTNPQPKQQLYLKVDETVSVMRNCVPIRAEMVDLLKNKHEEIPISKQVHYAHTEEQEAANCHFSWTIHETNNRKVVLSYRMYDVNNKQNVYLQIKLFTRGEGVFARKAGVTITLDEFDLLICKRDQMMCLF